MTTTWQGISAELQAAGMDGWWTLTLEHLFGPDPEGTSGVSEGTWILPCEGFSTEK